MEIKTKEQIAFEYDEDCCTPYKKTNYKQKWVTVDNMNNFLSKFKPDTPLSVIVSALHDEGFTKELSIKPTEVRK